eukprot:1902816-Prymnesium_polylepis.1
MALSEASKEGVFLRRFLAELGLGSSAPTAIAPPTSLGTDMWVPDLGLALRVCPGMSPSAGADCSAPGISPCPLRGSRP